jgi:cytochrome c peroxidase
VRPYPGTDALTRALALAACCSWLIASQGNARAEAQAHPDSTTARSSAGARTHPDSTIARYNVPSLAQRGRDREGAYSWHLPPGFPPPSVPPDNPMSAAKAALGCKLFFEPRLSATGTHSCATCHRPQLAFTDGRGQAVGATNATLTRGAMALGNVAYNTAFTWASDSVVTLETQMEQPLFSEHPVEMGLKRDGAALASLLAADPSYTAAFHAAFPHDDAPGTPRNMIKAIASFERTLLSGRSAFDKYVFDDDRAALSAQAKRGMALFFSDRAGCSRCHFGLNFSGPIAHGSMSKPAPAEVASASIPSTLFANNGTFDASADADRGLADVTHRDEDLGRFRVPTLRNIELTAPYMHDGRHKTLTEVVDHYASGARRADGRAATNLDPAIRPLDLTREDKRALLEFLRSLTDPDFVGRSYDSCTSSAGSP